MQNAKILIIDDQEVNVEILAQILKDAGYDNVYVETDSRQGLARYQHETFDLLLLDLLMPYINGLDILRQLQIARRTTFVGPSVVSSGNRFNHEQSYQPDNQLVHEATDVDAQLPHTFASYTHTATPPAPTTPVATPPTVSQSTSLSMTPLGPDLQAPPYAEPVHEKAYRPVIVLTADTSPRSKYEALSLGANDFITKPFDVQDVLLRTRNLLEMRAMHLQLVSLNQSLEVKVAERTAKLKQMYDKVQHDAFHDPLTDLPNRALFIDRLEQAISRFKQGLQQNCVVVFADFDRFKIVNDSLGYSAGNDLLVAIAERFSSILATSDSVARLHADEFVLLIQEPSSNNIQHVVSKLQEAFVAPFEIAGNRLYVSVSLGVVAAEHFKDGAEACLRNAELAMHQAKATGRGQYELFTQELLERTLMLLQLETHLRYAAERNEFRLMYQPIVNAATGALTGFEALVRWHHGKYGVVSPGEFIPYAEETGLIVDIDRWVLQQACVQLCDWQRQFPTLGIHLNVNMTAQQLAHGDLQGYLHKVISNLHIAPQSINVEFIESVLLQDSEWVLSQLKQLRKLGVQLYIDDFGTGYSSLSYLQTLNANALKIDRSFVQNMFHGYEGYELVKTILQIAHSLQMAVVAEGVETIEQYLALRDLGCDFLQGYFIAQPLAAADAQTLLEQSLQGQAPYQHKLDNTAIAYNPPEVSFSKAASTSAVPQSISSMPQLSGKETIEKKR
jgi:diguanylate cyclase (GGDEF)-like protein